MKSRGIATLIIALLNVLLTIWPLTMQAQIITFKKIADFDTQIPGEVTGKTFGVFGIPALSNGYVAFFGYENHGQVGGIYKYGGGVLSRVADENTWVPGETNPARRFSNFEQYVSVDADGQVAFLQWGLGVYTDVGGSLNVVANKQTPIPSGSETFRYFGEPTIDGGNVAFWGSGAYLINGIYTDIGGSLQVVADTNTPIPLGIGNFTFFGDRHDIHIDSGNVVFTGGSANQIWGVYLYNSGLLSVVADTETLVPGSAVSYFSGFTSVHNDGQDVAFTGCTDFDLGCDGFSQYGVYTWIEDTLNTVVAGRISPVSIDKGNVAFAGQGGIFTTIDGSLRKIIEVDDPLGGETVSYLATETEALSGNQIAFRARFGYGSKYAIYVAEIGGPPEDNGGGNDPCANTPCPGNCRLGIALGICILETFYPPTPVDPKRIVILRTGSPVSLSQKIDIPATAEFLTFDYWFLTTTGELKVLLGGTEILSIPAPSALEGDFLSTSVLVDGEFLSQSDVILEVKMDGPTGSVAMLDNIAFPDLVNGDFQTGDLTGWFGAVSGDGLIRLVTPVEALQADAGPDQSVNENDLVTLDGSNSRSPQGNPLTYQWSQIAGVTVALDTTDPVHPTFTAPFIGADTTLTFQLIVEDGVNASEPATVDITVENFNNPPTADAGDNSTIKEGAVATLDGSNSYDLENDPISYMWTQLEGLSVALTPSASAIQPQFTAPEAAGSRLIFKLQVSDGNEASELSPGSDPDFADTVAVDIVLNSAPQADAGSEQTKDEGNVVMLDGQGSSDPDGGDTLTYQWGQTAGTSVVLHDAASATPSFDAPPVDPGGEALIFELVVTDDDPVNPLLSSDEVTIHVRNINDPPNCNLAIPSTDRLWPPNHKMEPVSVDAVIDDDSSDNLIIIQIIGVTQDELVNGLGDGDSSPDAVVQYGDPADSVLLRAERAGDGNGRVYSVNFTASDGFESCDGALKVTVPHSRKSTAIDDGQDYDATQF